MGHNCIIRAQYKAGAHQLVGACSWMSDKGEEDEYEECQTRQTMFSGVWNSAWKFFHPKKMRKMRKIWNKHGHFRYIINPCIPATPQVQVAVCLSVPKSTTTPIPASPILNPSPCLPCCQFPWDKSWLQILCFSKIFKLLWIMNANEVVSGSQSSWDTYLKVHANFGWVYKNVEMSL